MGVMDQLSAFFDEMEKIGISVRDSSFRQTRKGRRPIRVQKLLEKETAFKPRDGAGKDDEGSGDRAQDYEAESGPGMQEGPEA
jgi:hypothetical protein